ncbi:NUDIX domain-containing protein [Novipirellula artificiosorum]|uniref:GDP-mannose mannosyl hydrolase n=1 Tax=Novipirellula artificiosorum TaxID=2528016 RepID=A0A5C6DZ86_9BACT|nr:NUDIX domain-containing protein [Novipirellula artificiosorum]TWU41735.1 GDP-mannose mannosyl hydrolase [Novipirellula artificiosorum]
MTKKQGMSATQSEVPIEQAHRFCPSCGVKNPHVGRVPFRCPECAFANFFGPVAAVGALVTNDQGQLLLVRRARDPGQGKWGLPGGFVDRDETIEDALAREVYEETQLTLAQRHLMMTHPNHYHYGGIIVSVIDLFFVCKAEDDTVIRLETSELTEFRWVDATSELFGQMAFESNRIAIDRWVATTTT